ncbi:MAG TPA: hypothetical protein VK550_29215 [Polyangiaceae bacterium]|nr:hypothetical protein [Polyangiaceae bacterium]
MESVSAAAVVVTEKNGHLSASINGEMPGRTAVTVIVQSAGELSSLFAKRVERKAMKQDRRARPNFAVLCCGTENDSASWSARTNIAESLLSTIEDGGRLIISAEQQVGSRSLARFLALVDGLRRRSSTSRKSIGLQFHTAPPIERRANHRRLDERAHWRMTG